MKHWFDIHKKNGKDYYENGEGKNIVDMSIF